MQPVFPPTLSAVYKTLSNFANSSNFWQVLETVFGLFYDLPKAEAIRSQWRICDFSNLPNIEVLSSEVLGGTNGAYASSKNEIYLSDRLLRAADPEAIKSVLLEEIGHWIDSQINTTDSPGDEGEIFAILVQENGLSIDTLKILKEEDDSAVIVVNGEAISIEQNTSTIRTASGDGGLQVTVDEFGGFNTALYDPVGVKTLSDTTYDSFVALGIINAGGITGARTQLNSSASNNEVFANFNNIAANSTFTVGGLNFQLQQAVQDVLNSTVVRTGSRLDQTYTITNTTAQTINFDLVRYVDGDLSFDGSLIDGGGRIVQNGQEILFETDRGETGQTDTTFFGVTGNGGTTPTTNRWQLDFYSTLKSRVLGGNNLQDIIARGDSNSNQFIDLGSEYDVALALRNVFSLAPGQTTTYTTTTRLGSGATGLLDITPPVGGIGDLPATIVGTDIGVTWSAIDPSGIRNYDVFVSVNGGAFTQWQTDVTTTSATYRGDIGKTYTFYSLATDNAGNEQIATTANRVSTQLGNATPGTLSFSNSQFSIREDGTQIATVTVTRSGGSRGAVSAILNLRDGTAKAPDDYRNAPITVNFADGETSRTITIPIVNDALVEPNETVFLSLASPTGGATIGQQNNATLTILDANPGTLAFSAPQFSAPENSTLIAAVTVTRSGGSRGAVSAILNLRDGTAKAPDDYRNAPITVNFADGETSRTVTIPVVNDAISEPDETVFLSLTNPTGGATIGQQNNATLTILDAKPGTLAFSSPQFSVREDGRPIAAVTVTRSGGSRGAVSAILNLRDGTAKAPGDYTNTPISINFANGETSKIVTIPIVNDAIAELDETLQLTLTRPTGGATIGQQNSATLTILDNDGVSIISFPQGASGSNKGQATIVIAGQKFLPTDQISLVAPNGTVRTASQTYWVNGSETWATFDLQGLNAGRYDVKVANGPSATTANAAFTVTNGSLGNIQTRLTYPAPGVVTVNYTNTGQTDVTAPLFRIAPTNAQFLDAQGIALTGTATSPSLSQLLNLGFGASDEGPAGILAPGKTGSVSLRYTPNGNGAISFTVEQVRPDEVIDWTTIKAQVRADYGFIDAGAWDAIWSNFTAAVGQTYGQFQAVMAENANYLSQLGEPAYYLSPLFAFEWKKAANTLTNVNLLSTTDVVDAAPGLSLTFDRTFHASLAERYNLGTLGRGWSSQWDVRATTDSNGNVVIRSVGDLQRLFEQQANGTYTEAGGATLTIVNGQYRLKEVSGLISLFGSDGKLNYVEDTNSNRITLQYANNRLTRLVQTNGDSLTLAYNAQGRISQITDSTGQITRYSYDATGETLLSATTPQGSTTYTYDTGTVATTKYSLLSETSAQGYQRNFAYDNQGRLIQESSNGQTQTLNYRYDSVGGVTLTDSTGAAQTLLLDGRGNPAQIRGVNNQNLLFRYDADGNLTGTTLPNGGQTAYNYDATGNLTRQTNLASQNVRFTYDSTFNQLTGFTDAKGNQVRYGYDAKGNLAQITYADGSTQQFRVDATGNITSAVNRRGSTIQYTYNTSGQLTKKEYADGSSVVYGYDTRGNVTSVIDATGTTTLQYDGANQLTGIRYPNGRSLQYTYNADGQRTQLVSNDGYTVNYSYDAIGRLKSLTDGVGQSIIRYDYDSAGRLIKETNGNGTSTTYAYDAQSQLTRLVNYQANNTVNSQFEYVYDNLGRSTSMTTLEGTFQYGYDATGQLTSVVTPTGRTLQYQYDAAGNRLSVTDNGITTNYSSNNLNEYTSVGNATYAYDRDGNLISKTQGGQTSTYTYDAENRLTKVVTPQGTWEYQYDGLGNRVATIVNGQRTDYLLDPTGLGNIVGEYNSSGNLVAHYTQGIGLVSRVDGSNSANYYDADALGSTVGLTAANGSYVDRYSYLPFGESLSKVETVANPFEYVGQWGVTTESNGLDFMRERFYDSSLGRFTATDPIGLSGGDANLYRYASNNPVSFIDPTGEFIFIPILIGAAIGALEGAVIDIGIQWVVNDSIDWGDVGIAAGLGAIGGGIGAGLGAAGSLTREAGTEWSHWIPSRFSNPNSSYYKNLPRWATENSLNGNFVPKVEHALNDPFRYRFMPKSWKLDNPINPGWLRQFNRIPNWLKGGLGGGLGGGLVLIGGRTHNDPHLQTLDGLSYDLQSVGEFTLVKANTDDFEIQTRQQPYGSSNSVSTNTAVAIKTGGQRIAFYVGQTQPLVINGTLVSLPDGGLYAVGQNLITRTGSQYSIFTANNDLIQINDLRNHIDLSIGLADNRKGNVVGLLGNNNGNRNDDFALRDGTVIGSTISNQQLYGTYANSWRITQPTSLFDYAPGQNTNSFTNFSFPTTIVTTATLTPAQRAAALQIAQAAGITDPTLLDNAILDIAQTNGAPEFIQAYTTLQRAVTVSAANTLINPNGFGNSHWLPANTLIPNIIRFTNSAAQGTTPIAQVTITQQLDADLDLNTFSLSNIGFGSITLTIPTGTKNYSQRLDLRSTSRVYVDVNAGLNPTTGVVTWTFTAIDPATGSPANSASQGFLPADDSAGAGQGFVGYSIQPKANATTSTRIDARARITFNNQTSTQTDPVFNTLDSDLPTSTITAVPTISTPSFTVSWSGTDRGSGIAGYDIWVSTDRGAFTPWQINTTATTATYVGQSGHTYAFHSVAHDNAGNLEAVPAALPTLSINNIRAVESTSGSSNASFTVTLSSASTQPVSVNYATVNGTAVSGVDYTAVSGNLRFAAGETTQTITVPILSDNLLEPNETFLITLNGATNAALATTQGIGTIVPTAQSSSYADFNQDGKTDFVWRNYATGQNAIWLMDGTTLSQGVFITPVPDLNWSLAGTGDFNQDGKSDLIWRNYATGQNAIWLMDGTTLSQGVFITPVPDPNWSIAGTGNFNQDGKVDLIWRNGSAGKNAIWLMNGTSLSEGVFLNPDVSDFNWRIGNAYPGNPNVFPGRR